MRLFEQVPAPTLVIEIAAAGTEVTDKTDPDCVSGVCVCVCVCVCAFGWGLWLWLFVSSISNHDPAYILHVFPQAILWSNLFKYHLELGHSEQAYRAMLGNPDPVRCVHVVYSTT